MLPKDAEAAIEREPCSKLESQIKKAPIDLPQARAQNATDMDLLEGVKIALAFKGDGPITYFELYQGA